MASSVSFCSVVLLLFLLRPHFASARWTWDTFVHFVEPSSQGRSLQQTRDVMENSMPALPTGSYKHVQDARRVGLQSQEITIFPREARLLETDDYVAAANPSPSSTSPPPFP